MKFLILILSILINTSIFSATGTLGQRSVNSVVPLTEGVPITTEWTSFTPSWTNFVGNTPARAEWRRVGESMEIAVRVTHNGVGSGGDVSLAIPDSKTSGATADAHIGDGHVNVGTIKGLSVVFYTGQLRFIKEGESADYIDGTEFSDGNEITFNASIPITEWADSGVTGQADISAYIPDATASVSGIVNTTTQTFGGNKIFTDNVGIGTDSPGVVFHIYGEGEDTVPSGQISDSGTKTSTIRLSGATAGGGYGGAIEFGSKNTSAVDKTGAAIKYELVDGDNNTRGNISFYNRLVNTDAYLSRTMTIDSSGNVGIGTNSPGITSYGAGRPILTIKGATGAENYGILELYTSQSDASGDLYGGIDFGSGTNRNAMIRGVREANDDDAYLSFWTRPTGDTITERMRITSGGVVKIGEGGGTWYMQFAATPSGTVRHGIYGTTDLNFWANTGNGFAFTVDNSAKGFEIGTDGIADFKQGISFPNGGENTLSHYQINNESCSWTGASGNSVRVRWSRVGNSVLVSIDQDSNARTATSSYVSLSSCLPSGIRPSTHDRSCIVSLHTGSYVVGIMEIETDGSIELLKDTARTAWSSETFRFFQSISCSYTMY